MTSAFSAILNGRQICHKLLEDEEFVAFLSETPIREGHTIVIPKKEIDALFEMEDGLLSRMIVFSKKAAHLIKPAIPCVKIGLMAAGIQVRHAHLHLVPMDQPADLDFSKAKSATNEELTGIANKIKKPKREL